MASTDVQATYGVQVLVEGEQDALDTADALEKLRDEIADDTASLREMQKALRALQQSTTTSKESFSALREQIAAKKVQVGQGAAQLVKMKGAFDGLGPSARKAAEAQKAALDAQVPKTKGLPGDELRKSLAGAFLTASPAAAAFNVVLGKVRDTMKDVAKEALIVVGTVAAVAAVVAAVGFATAAMTKFAIASADARNSESIDLQARGTRLWLGYGEAVQWVADVTEKEANAIQYAVDRVSRTTATAREKIADFAGQLEEAGLRGQDLEKALHAVSTAAAVGKESGLVGMFAGARYAGQSIDQLANRIETKLGPIAARKFMTLDVQVSKLKEHFRELFKGVNIAPFLAQVDRLVQLFSQTSVIGYELRKVFEALFPESKAKSFGDVAQTALEYVTIGALATTLAILELIRAFERLKEILTGDWLTAPLEKLANTGLFKGANHVMQGLLKGIGAGQADVGAAAGETGDIVQDKFNAAMQIQSPSRRMFQSGRMIPAGAALGIRSGLSSVEGAADDLADAATPSFAALGIRSGLSSVEGAADDLADAATPSFAAASPGSPSGMAKPMSAEGRGARGGVNVALHMAPGAVQIHGKSGDDTSGILADLEQGMAEVFERAAQQFGAQLETA